MLHFVKMHGIGNDYIYIDTFAHEAPEDVPALARRLSDRHTGVGGDGLILIQPSQNADCRMRMFNADGSEGRMCGNAIRCIARYMLERHGDRIAGDDVRIETLSGVKTVSAIRDEAGRVSLLRADMGAPGLTAESIPVRADTPQNVIVPFGADVTRGVCVSMGSPHVVLFVDCDPMELGLERIGAPIERDPLFPERVNVEFVRPLPDGSLQMRVWERGSGETMACGTGACAAAVAAMLTGRVDAREVTVHLRGGDLRIQWDEKSGHVYMTGPAAIVFEGDWLGE